MTTLAQLKKKAKEFGFVEEMKELGFIMGPNMFWFYRKRGEYTDIIDFWLKSSREWVDVPIYSFCKEVIDHCDLSKFPKEFIKDAPCIGSRYLSEDGIQRGAWEIADDKTICKTFYKMIEVIKSEANQWLLNITTRETFFESLALHNQEIMHKKGLFLDLPLHDIQ